MQQSIPHTFLSYLIYKFSCIIVLAYSNSLLFMMKIIMLLICLVVLVIECDSLYLSTLWLTSILKQNPESMQIDLQNPPSYTYHINSSQNVINMYNQTIDELQKCNICFRSWMRKTFNTRVPVYKTTSSGHYKCCIMMSMLKCDPLNR